MPDQVFTEQDYCAGVAIYIHESILSETIQKSLHHVVRKIENRESDPVEQQILDLFNIL